MGARTGIVGGIAVLGAAVLFQVMTVFRQCSFRQELCFGASRTPFGQVPTQSLGSTRYRDDTDRCSPMGPLDFSNELREL
jgi:hypothetical protein